MESSQIYQLLQEIPLLAGLDEVELGELAQAMQLEEFSKGQFVLRIDDQGQCLLFLTEGRLAVTISNREGREITVDIIKPGEFFGELALLTGAPRSADVVALEDCKVLRLSEQDFEKHILSNNGLARRLLHDLASRLRDTTTKAANLVLLDVYRRLAQVLVTLGVEQNPETGKISVIEKRPTHRELAALTGTSREMVTRALKELESAGHVESDGKKIIVHSLPK